jgi:regulator of RNase E activity RraB
MQEYWESYVKPIEGHKAMVSFNAGMADIVPNPEFIYVAFVKVALNNPKEDGLVTEEESNDVGFIEDRLEMESLRWRSGKYMGRIITQGEVNFIYYLKMDFEWKDTVEAAMQHFPEYKYEFGSRMDMEWEVYQKLLFPTIREWQIIANHHSCNSLKEQGDNLKLPRAIEHKAYFENLENREKFIVELEKKEFSKQNEMEVPFNGKTMYGVQFYRKDTPHYYEIDNLTMNIIDMSEKYLGMYDGWECSLVK